MSTTVDLQQATTGEQGAAIGQVQGGLAGGNAQPGQTNTQAGTEASNAPLFRSFATQEDYDKEAARIRHNSEREAKKELLKALGLKPDEESRLTDIKKTWEQSLSDAEKASLELEQLRGELAALRAQLEEKDYTIAAMSSVAGAQFGEMDTIVRMAKGLKSDTVTIQDAVNTVVALIRPAQQKESAEPPKPGMPVGPSLMQPEAPPNPEPNPFRPGPNGEPPNLTEQGRLFRADPEKAKRLAREAGVPIYA